jgi:uncharacterized protein
MLSSDWVWYLVLAVVLAVGWFINILGLPGLWVMIAAAGAYAWCTGFYYLNWWHLGILVGIGVIAEIVEFVAGGAAARKAGGSGRATWGAIIGGVIGAIFFTIPFPIIGTIIGACLGAFLGAYLTEYTVRGETGHLMRVGWGAAKGKFLGIVSKLAFGVAILFVALIAGIPRGRPVDAGPVLPDYSTPTTIPATIPVD